VVSPQNDLYGHRRTLAGHAGVPPDQRVFGVVQHGWQIQPRRTGGMTAWHPRQYVWGRRDLGDAPDRHVIPIGAPFLYHPAVRSASDPGPTDQLLALPYHGYGVDLDGAHVQYADHLERLRSEVSHITVCLHPREYASPVRAIYESRGFSVATNGDGKDPAFMDRQVDRLLAHGTVTTNRASTGLFYAAALGRRVFVGGPFARSEDRLMASISYEDQVAIYRSAFPLLGDGLEGDDARALANLELGREFVLAPAVLAEVLGFRGARQAAARVLSLANEARRRAFNVRYRPRPEALGQAGGAIEHLRESGAVTGPVWYR
jgi:hypothetical protein